MTVGERKTRWVRDHYRRLRLHLVPFFGNYGLSNVTAGLVQKHHLARLLQPVSGKAACGLSAVVLKNLSDEAHRKIKK